MACFPHPATLSMTACRRAASHLRKADPVMRRLIRLHGPCSLGGERAEPFVHLVRAVVGQQVSAGAARSIFENVRSPQGEYLPNGCWPVEKARCARLVFPPGRQSTSGRCHGQCLREK